jgi:TolA-binding protein
MRLKKVFIFITILALISMLFIVGGCRKKGVQVQSGEQGVSQEDVSSEEESGKNVEEESAGDEGEDTKDIDSEEDKEDETGEDEETEGSGEVEDSNGQTEEEVAQEETEEEIEIPEEITAKLKEADDLFAGGFYAEASKEYRDAQIAIEGSELPDEMKQELLDLTTENYETSKNIVDTARMHHSNAMNLMYEKRYEEAEAELNSALDIYPKYQTAIDALESLEDIKGLQ